MSHLSLRLVATTAALALSVFACGPQEPEFSQQAPIEGVALLSTAQLQQWYKNQGGTLTDAALPAPASAASTDNAPRLNWSLLATVQIGAERVSLVPFADPLNPLAGSGYYAHRHLLIVQRAAQPPKAAIVEVVATTARTTAAAQTLFFDLYRKGKTRAPLPQQSFTGFVFYYTLRYEFQAGRCYLQGRETIGNPQLIYSGAPTGSAAAGGTAQRPNACTYIITSHAPPYVVDVCDGGSSGSGPFGGGSSSSGGGGGAHPLDYPELPGIDPGTGGSGDGPGPKFVPNMPTTMSPQITPGSCVTSSLSEVKTALCGGDPLQVESSMLNYAVQLYGGNYLNQGMPLGDITNFANHFFTTTILFPVGNYQGAIDAGYPIAIDVPSGINSNIWHSVIITGYEPGTSTAYYLDPATGTTVAGDGPSLVANAHYTIPITGCR